MRESFLEFQEIAIRLQMTALVIRHGNSAIEFTWLIAVELTFECAFSHALQYVGSAATIHKPEQVAAVRSVIVC